MMRRWALFLSGRGSTAAAALDLLSDLDIRLVVSSRASAYGLKRARRSGVKTLTLDKQINWQALSDELQKHGVDSIMLLGFMRLVPAEFLKSWEGRMWNLHPSLLPNYTGARALDRAIEDRAEVGSSIHDVILEMDAGKIRLQRPLSWHYNNELKNTEDHMTEMMIPFSQLEQSLVREFMTKNAFSKIEKASVSPGRGM